MTAEAEALPRRPSSSGTRATGTRRAGSSAVPLIAPRLRYDRSMRARALFFLVVSLFPAVASAQRTWPPRAVRIVATSPPGGSVDFLARALAEDFAAAFGVPFVVENRPGANGNMGAESVLKAPADGHAM